MTVRTRQPQRRSNTHSPTSKRHGRRRLPLTLERLEDRLPPSSDVLVTATMLAFDSQQQAQAAGALAHPNDVRLFEVSLNAGDSLSAVASAQAPGNLHDCLRLFDGAGHRFVQSLTDHVQDSVEAIQLTRQGLALLRGAVRVRGCAHDDFSFSTWGSDNVRNADGAISVGIGSVGWLCERGDPS